MPFFTERQTEEFLARETRDIPMPDGALKPVSGFKVTWANYDLLLALRCYTVEQLVDLTLRNSKAMGYSFEDSFQSVIAYCSNAARKKLGFD